MRKPIVLVCTMLSTVALTLAAPASNPGPSLRPVQAQSSDLTVTVDCESDPENTTVKNNSNASVTIETVGSIHEPRSNEPFPVNEQLDPGETVTFESGFDATQNVLVNQFIYDNEVGSQEGAEVVTSTGERFTALCGTASGGSGQGNPSGGAAAGGGAAGHQYRGDDIRGIPRHIKRLGPTGGPPLLGVLGGAGLLGAGLLLLRRT
jgi:hypothetical protein